MARRAKPGWVVTVIGLVAVCGMVTMTVGEDADTKAPLDIAGSVGGPFTPSTFSFGLHNEAQVGMYWSLVKCPEFVDVEAREGYLAPGEYRSVQAWVNTVANSMPVGTHNQELQVFFEPQPGDFTGDQKVNRADINIFDSCATGPHILVRPECKGPDLDKDGDVDQDDFGILQRCLSGEALATKTCNSGQPPQPQNPQKSI